MWTTRLTVPMKIPVLDMVGMDLTRAGMIVVGGMTGVNTVRVDIIRVSALAVVVFAVAFGVGVIHTSAKMNPAKKDPARRNLTKRNDCRCALCRNSMYLDNTKDNRLNWYSNESGKTESEREAKE